MRKESKKNVVSWEKLYVDNKEYKIVNLDCNRLVERAIHDADELAPIWLEITFSVAKLPRIEADAETFYSTVRCLIQNAIMANSKEYLSIEIGTEYVSNQSEVTFYIKDDRNKVDEKNPGYQQQLFQPTHNLEIFSDKAEISSISFHSVQKLVLGHKGRMWFENKSGESLTYFFYLGSLRTNSLNQSA